MSSRKADKDYVSRRTATNDYSSRRKAPSLTTALSDSEEKSYPKKQGDRLRSKLLVNNQQDPTVDTRNVLEKSLNLTPDQNVIFDIFEVLGRPQQALFGAIDSAQKGENVLEGAWQGLSGNKDTSGGQILRNAGIGGTNEGEQFNLLDTKTWDKFGVDDVVGLGLDIFLDPADLALFATTGGAGNIAKGAAKAVDTASDLSKAAKTASKASLNDLAFEALGKTAKGAANLADTAIGKGLKALDESRGYSYIGDLVEDTSKVANNIPLYQTYQGAKKEIGNALNVGKNTINKSIRALSNKAKGVASEIDESTAAIVKNFTDDLDKTYDKAVKLFADDKTMQPYLKDKQSFNKLLNEVVESNAQSRINNANYLGDIQQLFYKFGEEESQKGVTKYSRELRDLFKDIDAYAKKGLTESTQNAELLSKLPTDENQLFDNFIANKVSQGGTIDMATAQKEFIDEMSKLRRSVDNAQYYQESSDLLDKLLSTKSSQLVLDHEQLNNLSKIYSDYSKAMGYDLNPLYKSLTLGKDTPQMQAFNKLAQEFPEFTAKADKLFKTINDNTDDILYKNYGVIDATSKYYNDYKAADEFGDELPHYSGYARTQVNEGVLDILGKNKVDDIFSNRKERMLDTSSINNLMSNMSKDNLSQLFPTLSVDDVTELRDYLKNNDYYVQDLTSNVLNFAKNVPSNVAKANLKKDLIVSFGNSNMNEQVKVFDKIDSLEKQLKNETDIAKADLLKTELNQAKVNAQQLDKNALFRRYNPNNKYANTGARAVKVDDLISKIKHIDVNNNGEAYKNVISSIQKIAGDNDTILVNPMIDNVFRISTNTKVPSNFLNMLNSMTSMFKRNKLLSPAYNIRNLTGNTFNMYVAGVPLKDIPSLMTDSFTDINKANKAIELLKSGTLVDDLPADLKKSYDTIIRLRKYGFGDAAETATQLLGMEDVASTIGQAKTKIGKAVDTIAKANLDANILVDNTTRLAMMKYAEAHPEYLTKMGFKNAGQAVAYAMFDPSDLSDVEQNIIKKIVPFYTFTKKNLAFQIENLTKNSTRYKRVLKAIDAAWGDEDEQNIADYYKTGLSIPFSKDTEGNTKVLNLNLPFSDLIEWTDNPLNRAVSSLNPFIRMPYELATNTQTFSGMPISNFKGEESDLFNRLPFADVLPDFVDNATSEYLLGNLTGLDVPLKNVANTIDFAGSLIGTNDLSTFDSAINLLNLTGTNKPGSVQLSREYDELQSLQDYVDKLEQEGIDLVSVTDFEDTNKGKINSKLQAQIDELMGRKPDTRQSKRSYNPEYKSPRKYYPD